MLHVKTNHIMNGSAAPSEVVSTADAFAFILLLDPEVAFDRLENVENCRVFATFDELRSCVALTGPHIQSKPVIILSSDAPPMRDHLLAAGALHWQYGGKYVLSRAKCSYLSRTGKLRLEPVLSLEMHRVALLPSIMSMPVREALLPNSELLLFVPSNEFTVCIPQMPLTPEEIGRLERAYKPALQTPAEFERLARIGPLDHSILHRLEVRSHWTLAHQIHERLGNHRRLIRNLELESRDLSKSTVEATISLIARSGDDLIYLRGELAQFLLALSRRSDIILTLNFTALESYIALSRQCNKSDEIAQNISLVADELFKIDVGLISPLFEFFASSLSSEALNAVYCSAAAHFEGLPERCSRLAQSMRHYGHDSSLALLLVKLHRTMPKWLEKAYILRSFAPLLDSPLRAALTSIIGEHTVSNIRLSANVMDRFQSAVRAGDRVSARRLLHDDEKLAKVNFLQWMDGLRGLSNELREMALPVAELNMIGILSQPKQRLAAILFSDVELIEAMHTSGELDSQNDLNAVALNILGNNTMLNQIIFDRFSSIESTPMRIEGQTVKEVFENATISVGESRRHEGPLVSVIMSAYNPDLELMKIALDSISSQSWSNIEIIIVDDGSTGAIRRAIRNLSANYNNTELVRSEVNLGPYAARNLAMHKANGKFIAFQDTDDWSHPERIKVQLDVLLNCPQARVVTTEHIRIDRVGHVSLEGDFQLCGDGPVSSVFRAEVFKQIGGFAVVRSRGDVEMRERIVSYYGHQAVAILPTPMVLCYADSGTLSQTTRARQAQHLQLFRSNISRRSTMTSLFRDEISLEAHHQIPVPINLRAPNGGHS